MDETGHTHLSNELAGESALPLSARARLRCRLAKGLEETGDYEAARSLLAPFWRGVGQRPDLGGLEEESAAELLLRAGVLTGWLGHVGRIEGAQADAKDLIGESLSLFERLGLAERVADAQTELAYCYWREGAFGEARVLLELALDRLGEDRGELKAVALLRKALVESSATRFNDSLRILLDAAPLFEASDNHALKGRFHNELAYNFQSLASTENRADYTDRALVEFTAASYHFDQAGHARYRSHVENNLGLLYLGLGRFEEAHEHLDRARQSYPGVKNAVYAATVDETRARVFLAQGLAERAEVTARGACEIFERAGEFAPLAEAMTVLGAALARLGRNAEARSALERAASVAEQSGSVESAGLAVLTLLEELPAHLSADETRDFYRRADELLAHSQHPEVLARLRRAARLAVESRPDAAVGARTLSGGVEDDRGEERSSAVRKLVVEAVRLGGKEVAFTDGAVEAMSRLFRKDEAGVLESLVAETIAAAEPGAVITPEAVEVVALRAIAPRGNFAQPWADFSLKEELRRPEKRFIELALKAADGKISVAARLLGLNHNEILTSIIKSRYPELLAARLPPIPRRRSIIRKPRR